MDEPIPERDGHVFEAYDLRPLCKGQIGGDGDPGPLRAIAKELEQQCSGRFGEGEIAQLIQQDQIEAAILARASAVPAAPGERPPSPWPG